MNRPRIRNLTTRFFLSVGYLMGALGWLWVLLVLVPSVIKSGVLDSLVTTNTPAEPVVAMAPIETSPVAWAIIGVVTLIILVVTVIILIRIPRTIVHSGEQLVNQTAKAVIPVIAHHKPLPAKQQRILSRRVVLALQLVLSIAPLVISLFLPAYDELTTEIIMTVAVTLAVNATVSFALAWLIEPKQATSRTRSRASRG